jgi:hypothetical protein
MKMSLLFTLILVALIEILVMNKYPLGAINIPLTLVVFMVLIKKNWISKKEALLFGGITGYLLDIFGAIKPGVVILSLLLAIGFFVIIKNRFKSSNVIGLTGSLLIYCGIMTFSNSIGLLDLLMHSLSMVGITIIGYWLCLSVLVLVERRL